MLIENMELMELFNTLDLTPLITTLPLLPVELPKTTHLPPLGK